MSKKVKPDLFYSQEHEWVKVEGDEALIGITDYAQSCLGDVVYVELPKIGQELKINQAIGVVESVKAVSDIFAPITGSVMALNDALLSQPELINQDPYKEAWMLRLKLSEPAQLKNLMNAKEYQDFLDKEAK